MSAVAEGHNSASRAFALLDTLAAAGSPLTAMGLARRCAIPRSTTYVLLRTMEAHGYVRHVADRHRWEIGPAAGRLATAARDVITLGAPIGPLLTRAAKALGADVAMVILCGDETIHQAVARSAKSAPVLPTRGARLPCTGSAGGRAILAQLDPRHVDAMFPAWRPMARIGGTGPTTINELQEILAHDRSVGHSTVQTPDIATEIAVAIPDLAAAVTVGVLGRPSDRFVSTALHEARSVSSAISRACVVAA